jgi:Major intrinsic protein
VAAALVCELVMTFFFVLIVHGATDKRAPAGVAGLAIGLGLTLIHLISIPVTNTSVNPARRIGPAVFVGGWALSQLCLCIVAPIVGGLAAGLVYRMVFEKGPQAAPWASQVLVSRRRRGIPGPPPVPVGVQSGCWAAPERAASPVDLSDAARRGVGVRGPG